MSLSILAELLLPPSSLILIFVVAMWLRQRYPRFSLGLFITTIALFYALSIPFVTGILMSPLQSYSALTEQQIASDKSEAIVVLGAGRRYAAREFNNMDTVPALGLERLRYAAWLKRRTHLPIVVSGGKLQKENLRSEAELMRDVLQKEFLVEVNFMEQTSLNTYENGINSAKLLKNIGVSDIFLVTHAWHLPRAMMAFERQGINVLPAPTAYYGAGMGMMHFGLIDFLPNSESLLYSYYALHEYLGIFFYKIYYGL